jgi:hypothetical protein
MLLTRTRVAGCIASTRCAARSTTCGAAGLFDPREAPCGAMRPERDDEVP